MMAKSAIISEKIKIRRSRRSDFGEYASMLEVVIPDSYTNKKLGYAPELFSKKVFSSEGMKGWMRGNLYPAPKQKTWVAFYRSKMVGAVTIRREGKRNELRGFYILPNFQGIGLGKRLLKYALKASKGRDIILILYPHNRKSLKIYDKWGFKKHGKIGYHHWTGWPKGARMKYTHMLLTKDNVGSLLKRVASSI